ncbi:hypothetical protein MJ583_21590 [Escherichia coli]|nr:hypothetical protein MJ583_21590 [Escherichia coli]
MTKRSLVRFTPSVWAVPVAEVEQVQLIRQQQHDRTAVTTTGKSCQTSRQRAWTPARQPVKDAGA